MSQELSLSFHLLRRRPRGPPCREQQAKLAVVSCGQTSANFASTTGRQYTTCPRSMEGKFEVASSGGQNTYLMRRTPEYIANQLYGSTTGNHADRKESLYNAVLHDKSTRTYTYSLWFLRKLTYSFIGGEISGRDGLPELARGTARDNDWKHMGQEEEERVLQQLRDFKAEKALAKVTKVSPEFTANDIETTIRRMNTEVSRAQHRVLVYELTMYSSRPCRCATTATSSI